MPCDSAGHMVQYTACGHFTVTPSSQQSPCDLENCEDHSPRTCSYLPEVCPNCKDIDSMVSTFLLDDIDINLAKPKSFDDKQKSTSKKPFEAETKSSFQDNCECSSTTIQYEGCNHTLQTIHRTKGCAKECAYRYGSECGVSGACPDCSAQSRLKGNDKENLHDPVKGCMSPDRLMRNEIKKIAKKLKDQELTTNSIHGGTTKKVEGANKDVKKFIAALKLTGPIKTIFAEAEQGTTQAHEISWELKANQLFLELETAARAGMDSEIANLKQSFLDEGENFKNQIKSQLEMVKEGVMKQCEAGVKQMLEAFENSTLEDSFPLSPVL